MDIPTTGASSAAASSTASPAGSPASAPRSTPASATPTPAAPSPSPAPVTEPGPIPFDRHKSILDGAYSERDAAQRALDEYQQQYGWATQFTRDPYTFVDSWIDQLAEHPQYGPQIIAKAARLLHSRRGSVPVQAEEPPPDVPIQDAAGNLTGHTYSAAQLKKWQEWHWAQRDAALTERLRPLEQMREGFEEQQVTAQIRAVSDEHAKTTLAELRQDPYFAQHEPKVKAALIAHPEWGDDVYRAFHHVLRTEVLPNIHQTAEAKVLDQLKTQAAGGTVNPSQTAPTQRPKFKDFGEALRYYADHPDEAAQMAQR